ncbi:hypothetical protein [Streptomyces sp. IBSBF 2435]
MALPGTDAGIARQDVWKTDGGPHWQVRTGHMLAIVIDGLRAGTPG